MSNTDEHVEYKLIDFLKDVDHQQYMINVKNDIWYDEWKKNNKFN